MPRGEGAKLPPPGVAPSAARGGAWAAPARERPMGLLEGHEADRGLEDQRRILEVELAVVVYVSRRRLRRGGRDGADADLEREGGILDVDLRVAVEVSR